VIIACWEGRKKYSKCGLDSCFAELDGIRPMQMASKVSPVLRAVHNTISNIISVQHQCGTRWTLVWIQYVDSQIISVLNIQCLEYGRSSAGHSIRQCRTFDKTFHLSFIPPSPCCAYHTYLVTFGQFGQVHVSPQPHLPLVAHQQSSAMVL